MMIGTIHQPTSKTTAIADMKILPIRQTTKPRSCKEASKRPPLFILHKLNYCYYYTNEYISKINTAKRTKCDNERK